MSIAAVPRYLPSHQMKETSPALRFGLLLSIWTTREDQEREVRNRSRAKSPEGKKVADMLKHQGMDATIHSLRQRDGNSLPGLWDKNDFSARGAWGEITELTPRDVERMNALAERQGALRQALGEANLLFVQADAVAPFATGLGNEHPLENGFAFLWPYGLPYLPGSGVKGVLRQAARELASGDWGDAKGWDAAAITALFGRESGDHDTEHQRGALSFWDVIPRLKGNRLMVEIMTPHQKHYYQDGDTPHDSGQPNPISFLTVPPGSEFEFHVLCDPLFLRRLAPELAEEDRWKTLLRAAFHHAFQWLGFGAKTAVGYGQMAEPKERTAGSGSRDAAGDQGETWENVVLKLDPGSGELSVTHRGIVASARNPEAQKLRDGLPPERKKRLKKKKELKGCTARVEKQGNAWRLAEIIAAG